MNILGKEAKASTSKWKLVPNSTKKLTASMAAKAPIVAHKSSYKDHGYYVTRGRGGLRILVRDDGREILMYKDGKRVEDTSDEMLPRAQHLQIVIRDINELEKRIRKTSLEIQKYQKRLQ